MSSAPLNKDLNPQSTTNGDANSKARPPSDENGHSRRSRRRSGTWWDNKTKISSGHRTISAAYVVAADQGIADVAQDFARQIRAAADLPPTMPSLERFDPQRLVAAVEQSAQELPSYVADRLAWLSRIHATPHAQDARELERLARDDIEHELQSLRSEIKRLCLARPGQAIKVAEALREQVDKLVYPPVDSSAWPQAKHDARLVKAFAEQAELPAMHRQAIRAFADGALDQSLAAATTAIVRERCDAVHRAACAELLRFAADQAARSQHTLRTLDALVQLASDAKAHVEDLPPGRTSFLIPGRTADQIRKLLCDSWQKKPHELSTEIERRSADLLRKTLAARQAGDTDHLSFMQLVARLSGQEVLAACQAVLRAGAGRAASLLTLVAEAGLDDVADQLIAVSEPTVSLAGYEFPELGVSVTRVAVLEHPEAVTDEERDVLARLRQRIEGTLREPLNLQVGRALGLCRVSIRFPKPIVAGFEAQYHASRHAIEAGHQPNLFEFELDLTDDESLPDIANLFRDIITRE